MSLANEQKALRKMRIGASEIGALVDFYAPRGDGERVDPYKTAFDVFAERDAPTTDEAEDHRRWGLDLEDAILNNYGRRNRLTFLPAPGTMTHPEIGAICATPDALAVTAAQRVRDIQAKNAQHHQAWRWGEAGSDEVPLLYVGQVVMEQGIIRARRELFSFDIEDAADVVVSIGGAPPVGFPVQFDPELFGQLATLAEKFVRDHIATGKPPPIDASAIDSAAEWVRRKYPTPTLKLLDPTDDDRALVQLVATLRETGKAADTEKKLAEVQLKARLGDAQGFEGLCTFTKDRDSIGPDWKKIALSVDAAQAARLANDPAFLCVTREGPRKLRILNGKER